RYRFAPASRREILDRFPAASRLFLGCRRRRAASADEALPASRFRVEFRRRSWLQHQQSVHAVRSVLRKPQTHNSSLPGCRALWSLERDDAMSALSRPDDRGLHLTVDDLYRHLVFPSKLHISRKLAIS